MSSHSGREAGRHTWPQSHREPDAGSAARVGFRSPFHPQGLSIDDDGHIHGYLNPENLQARADACAAERGLTLPPGMVWSGRFNRITGECVDALAVSSPGLPVTPAGHRVGSVAWRHRRRVLRRHLARCRAMAVLCAVAMVGAFAADRPVAGVLASCLVFMLLRAAAETRAEL